MDNSEKKINWKKVYWIVGILGIVYILLLGLFTFLFNTPV